MWKKFWVRSSMEILNPWPTYVKIDVETHDDIFIRNIKNSDNLLMNFLRNITPQRWQLIFLNNISLWQIKLVVNLLEFCNDKGWGCSLRKVWLRRQGSYRFFSLNNIRPEKCISKRMQRIRPTRKLDVWNNFKFTFYLYLVPPVLLAL